MVGGAQNLVACVTFGGREEDGEHCVIGVRAIEAQFNLEQQLRSKGI